MTSSAVDRVEVAVVGGGPAGAATAALLAGHGHRVVLLERAPRWRWRPCGVFTAPAAVAALRRLGLSEADLARATFPVPAIRVETPGGTSFRLTYDGTGALADSAVGFDREALDGMLLDLARSAGADVRLAARVEHAELRDGQPRVTVADLEGRRSELRASVIVGADGLKSIVARAAGVSRRPPFARRTAMTFHVARPAVEAPPEARMVVLRDGYVGLAPVPGDRTNVGIVLGPSWSKGIQADGPMHVAMGILAATRTPDEPEARSAVTDRLVGVHPVSAAVSRRAGDGWILVGDAAGFLDPFTGEGLHRAFVSAELAAEATHHVLAGLAGARLVDYDAAMRDRFGTKDLVSRLVQAFVAQPGLFEYVARRLATRSGIRDTMGRVLGDLVPPAAALDPRFLAGLLAP
jgi:flavin-dependent dehydrogenase